MENEIKPERDGIPDAAAHDSERLNTSFGRMNIWTYPVGTNIDRGHWQLPAVLSFGRVKNNAICAFCDGRFFDVKILTLIFVCSIIIHY